MTRTLYSATQRPVLIATATLALTLAACGDEQITLLPGDTGQIQDVAAGDAADSDTATSDDASPDTSETDASEADTGSDAHNLDATPDGSEADVPDLDGTVPDAIDRDTTEQDTVEQDTGGEPEGDWRLELNLNGNRFCIDLTLGVPRIEEPGEQCLFSLGQGLNVDLFGSGGFENGSLCFESEDGFLPTGRYDSLAAMASVSPCDSGGDYFWSDYVEGFEGLANVGIWVRDTESGRLWKVLILDNLGDRFEAIGEEVPQ